MKRKSKQKTYIVPILGDKMVIKGCKNVKYH